MSRSVWKGPFVDPSLIKKVEQLKGKSNKSPIKTVSINQSRRPIYKDSVELNLKYKKFNNLFKDI